MEISTHRHFDKVEDFFEYASPWRKGYDLDGYVFRGHSDENYKLIPSALRFETLDWFWAVSGLAFQGDKQDVNQTALQVEAEFQVIRSFYRLADQSGLAVPIADVIRNYLAQDHSALMQSLSGSRSGQGHWIPDEMLEIAALAQHYGLPTRLLDWSYDINVAAYFATAGDRKEEGNFAIWALNRNYLSFHAESLIKFVTPHYAGNPNLSAQKGIFTHLKANYMGEGMATIQNLLAPVDRRPLDKVLEGKIEHKVNIFRKITIPCSEATRACDLLTKLGYGPARLFPGYGGVADQLLANGKRVK